MTRTLIIESGQKPTEEQLKEVEEAKKSPINFDEDCEELSSAMMKAFKSAVVQRNRKKKAQKYWGRILSPNILQMKNGYPSNLKNQKSEILESKMSFPQKYNLGDAVEKEYIQVS